MESIDEQKVQRVWQRVRSTGLSPLDPTALIPLILQESTDAAACLRLAKRWGGRGGLLLKLARQYRQNAGCMRGICSMVTGTNPEIPVPTLSDESPQMVLKRCYVNSLSKLKEYNRLAGDPDYGPVFEKMAAVTRDQCPVLLDLIGRTAT